MMRISVLYKSTWTSTVHQLFALLPTSRNNVKIVRIQKKISTIKMKYFIVFVAACVVAANAAFDEEFKAKVIKKVEEVGTACAAQENANGDDIAELMAKKAPTRKEGKCLVACFHEKFGVQDKDGKLNLDGAIASIEPFKAADEEIYGKMKQVIEKCVAEVGDAGDRCETAIKFAGCGKREGETLGLNESLIM